MQKNIDMSKVVEGGDTSADVRSGVLVETDITGEIYFIWDGFDHFNITDATSDVDLTPKTINFQHLNSISIDNDGNYVISSRLMDEVTKINKNTGEIIWRFGGKECKNNQFTFLNDTIEGFWGFSHQHSANVLPNGNILLFDNGNLKPEQYSRAVEYNLNLQNMTATKVWEYRYSPDIYRESMANVQRLDNGNTLINLVIEKITEVRPDKSIAFEMILPEDFATYRAFRYLTRMNAKRLNINSSGNFNFNGNGKEATKVSLNLTSVSGNGSLTVEKHDYSPPKSRMSFVDSSFSSILPLRWVFNKIGLNNIQGELIIKANEIPQLINPDKVSIYKRDNEASGGFSELITNYNSLTNELTAQFSGFGEFIICSKKLDNILLAYPENNKTSLSLKGTLRWQKLKGATNYNIQLSDDNLFSNKLINIIANDTNETEYSVQNFSKQYFWRVRGMNNKDTSQWSDVYSFSTGMQSPVLIEPNNNDKGVPLNSRFSWNMVSSATNYNVQVASDLLFKNIIVDKHLNNNTYEIQLPENNKSYFWRVRAYHIGDTSSWSDTWSFTTELPIPVLEYPSNNEMNADTSGKFLWNDCGKNLGYNIVLSKDSIFTDIVSNFFIIPNNLDYEALEYNREYYWKVRCISENDTGNWSEIFKFETRLSRPVLISPADRQIITTNKLLLIWNNVPGSTIYNIDVGYDRDFLNIYQKEQNFTGTSLILNNIPKGTELFWRVSANNDKKSSQWSEIRSFKVMYNDTLIPKPILLSPDDNAIEIDTSGLLIWHSVTNIGEYNIELSHNYSFSSPIIHETVTADTMFIYNNLDFETKYYWRVRAVKSDTLSDWSDIWSFTTKQAITVEEEKSKMQNIMVNDGILRINSKGIDFKDISIYNLSGQRMQLDAKTEFNEDETIINISNFPDGVYFLHFNVTSRLIQNINSSSSFVIIKFE
jgi:hypothetical protein